MSAILLPSGKWAVVDASGAVLADDFASNAEAWRWIERRTGEPVSAAEKRSQFGTDRFLLSGAGE